VKKLTYLFITGHGCSLLLLEAWTPDPFGSRQPAQSPARRIRFLPHLEETAHQDGTARQLALVDDEAEEPSDETAQTHAGQDANYNE
jgi:hypothetical protein